MLMAYNHKAKSIQYFRTVQDMITTDKDAQLSFEKNGIMYRLLRTADKLVLGIIDQSSGMIHETFSGEDAITMIDTIDKEV